MGRGELGAYGFGNRHGHLRLLTLNYCDFKSDIFKDPFSVQGKEKPERKRR
jgi:hypothetical protein